MIPALPPRWEYGVGVTLDDGTEGVLSVGSLEAARWFMAEPPARIVSQTLLRRRSIHDAIDDPAVIWPGAWTEVDE